MSAPAMALLLCAGRGTRLGALTADTPKPLLDVGGAPIATHTLRLLARHGVTRVAINVHHLADKIRAALGDGSSDGVAIEYLVETSLSGTAGPLVQWRERFAEAGAVVIIYGDLVLDFDLRAMLDSHHASRADVTLMVHQRAGSNSVVVTDDDGRIVRFLERPSAEERAGLDSPWVNSGVQILAPSALDRLPTAVPCDLPRDLYVPHVAALRMRAFPLDGFRVAIDSPERLALARETWPLRASRGEPG